jgi:hypothetical protein
MLNFKPDPGTLTSLLGRLVKESKIKRATKRRESAQQTRSSTPGEHVQSAQQTPYKMLFNEEENKDGRVAAESETASSGTPPSNAQPAGIPDLVIPDPETIPSQTPSLQTSNSETLPLDATHAENNDWRNEQEKFLAVLKQVAGK